jgi:hypothetical protein
VSAPSPSSSLPIPLPAASHADVVVAVFLILLFGTSAVLWWQVRREYRRRAEEAMRRMGPADD